MLGVAARERAEWDWRSPTNFRPGGGWAVPYTPATRRTSNPTRRFARSPLPCSEACATLGLPLPTLVLEPGREIVARAGVALYRVGALKQAGGVQYAFLDGGLADNPRPALYEARYHALLANRTGEGARRATPSPVPFASRATC